MDGIGKGGAKPTAAQVKKLEEAHKKALANLLQAIRFRYLVYTKLGKDSAEWKKYAQLVYDIGTSWYQRQMRLEKGGATKEGILPNDLFTTAGNEKLKELAKKWDSKGQGIGIIPLIIWAVVAMIGFFTAEEIVDELNTTTEEQTELINTTNEICEKYKFSAQECKAFLADQNDAVNPPDSFGGGMMKWVIIGVGGLLLYNNRDKIFKSKSS